MKKSLLMLAMGGILVACSRTANATGVALTIDNPYQNAIQGQNTVLTFTGSVVIDPGYKLTTLVMEYPGLTLAGPYISNFAYSASFSDFFSNSGVGDDYIGELFTYTVDPSVAAGDYFSNSLGWGQIAGLSEFAVTASGTPGTASDGKAIGITVSESGEPSVPGPAAAVPMALGLAASALRRRTKK